MTNTYVIVLRILAVALIAAAAYFYSTGEPDRVFACVVLAACSYFFSVRMRFARNVKAAETDKPGSTDA